MERKTSFDNKLNELDILDEPVPYELERHYLPIENFNFDWNMILYGEDEENEVIDWNKLIYGQDQMLEFDLQKNEKLMRPEFYDYMFRRASERTEIEKFYLKQSGFDAYDDDSQEEIEMQKTVEAEASEKIRRFIIDNKLRSQ